MLYLPWRGSLLYVVLKKTLHHTKGAELARCTLVKSLETERYDTNTASTVSGFPNNVCPLALSALLTRQPVTIAQLFFTVYD
jgi:hypothetical protein